MKFNTLYSALYSDSGYPFHRLAGKVERATHPDELKDENSALVVWGGSDIEPSFYGHEKSSKTWTNPERDAAEWRLMQKAIERGMTIIGVCRGAQMLCAAAGGFLLQHVENHSGYHNVQTKTGDKFLVNSIHHQMMAGLEKVDHELICFTEGQRSKQYIYKKDELFAIPENWKEPEYVYFNKIKGHAIQWHPEMLDEAEVANKFVLHEINARN